MFGSVPGGSEAIPFRNETEISMIRRVIALVLCGFCVWLSVNRILSIKLLTPDTRSRKFKLGQRPQSEVLGSGVGTTILKHSSLARAALIRQIGLTKLRK